MSEAGSIKKVMDEKSMHAALEKLADDLVARHGSCEDLALIGIQRRGVFLARRLGELVKQRLGLPVPEGVLDINLYRDDWTTMRHAPVVGHTILNFDVTWKDLVLVDDVLFTGRTIRAALEALVDFGRPRRVELLVLVDRGHRELPIQADYCGLKLKTKHEEQVDVRMQELDGRDSVELIR